MPCLPRLEQTLPGGTHEKRGWAESSGGSEDGGPGMGHVEESQGPGENVPHF